MGRALEPTLITEYGAAVAFLDARIGQGVRPGLERIVGLMDAMGNPHLAYPVVHVAGTNGKTSTTRMIADLLGAHGLRVGSFTSPHLQRIEHRFEVGGRPFGQDEFTVAMADVAPFVELYEEASGQGVTYFELTTAVALSAFAEAAVDAAVVEVGLGGRLDATNVVDSDVCVITGIALDHASYLGSSLSSIAAEKVAILGGGGVLVTAELPAAAEGAVTARVAETGSRWFRYGTDFTLEEIRQAMGGWSVTLDGIYERYEDVYLALHGRHQAHNLTTAGAAVEAFIERPMSVEALREAAAGVTSPGRLEVLGRRPLVLVDGAHNRQGFESLAATLREEFLPRRWILVTGMRGDRVPADLLEPLTDLVGHVIATAAADPDAISPAEVAAGAAKALGPDVVIEAIDAVPKAIERARALAGAEDQILVAGSLYVVGETRDELVGDAPPTSSRVHVRIDAPVMFEDEELDEEWPEGWDESDLDES